MALNIQPLRPYMLFTDKVGTLTKDAYDFLFALYQRVGGSLDSLNAATLQAKTWQEPAGIGSVTPNTGKFSTLEALNTFTAAGSVGQGYGLKHLRTHFVIPPGVSVITATWPAAFLDTNYTVVASLESFISGTSFLSLLHVETYTASQVPVTVSNTAGVALDGYLHLIAMHN